MLVSLLLLGASDLEFSLNLCILSYIMYVET